MSNPHIKTTDSVYKMCAEIGVNIMSFMDKAKNFFMPDDEEVETTTQSTSEEPASSATTNPTPERPAAAPTYSHAATTSTHERPSTHQRVMPAASGMEVSLVEATSYVGDSKKIADLLMQGKTVLLNFEKADKDNTRRITDFVVGAAYVSDAVIKKIANKTFIVVPKGVGFDGVPYPSAAQDDTNF